MKTIDAKRFYENWHQDLPVDRETEAPWHRLVKRYLEEQRLDGSLVLEMACGRGGFAFWLATKYARIVAADFATSALIKGKANVENTQKSEIYWSAADAQMLPFCSEVFDLVVSCETIEHLIQPRKAVKEFARVLIPGGALILTTPNYFSTMGLYRAYLRVRGRKYSEGGQPINNVTLLPFTRSWIRDAGLRIVHTDAIGHYFFFPKHQPIELQMLNRPRFLMRWFALHSMIVAIKPIENRTDL